MLKSVSAFLMISFLTFTSSVCAAVVQQVIDGCTIKLADGRTVVLIGVDSPRFENHEQNRRNAERLGIELEHYEIYAKETRDFIGRWVEGKEVRLEYDEVKGRRRFASPSRPDGTGSPSGRPPLDQPPPPPALASSLLPEARAGTATSRPRPMGGAPAAVDADTQYLDEFGRTLAYVWLPFGFFPKEQEHIFYNHIHNIDGKTDVDWSGEFMLNQLLVAEGYSAVYAKFPFKYRKDFLKVEESAREEERGIWSCDGCWET